MRPQRNLVTIRMSESHIRASGGNEEIIAVVHDDSAKEWVILMLIEESG